MRLWRLSISTLTFGLWTLILFGVPSAKLPSPATSKTAHPRIFSTKGVVLSVNRNTREIVIRHEAISNYLGAMTMPFKVKTAGVLSGLQEDDEISFQLHVTETESWVDQIVKTGTAPPAAPAALASLPVTRPMRPLLDYNLTNELVQAVSLDDFRGFSRTGAGHHVLLHALSAARILPATFKKFSGGAAKTPRHVRCAGQLASAVCFI